MKKIKRETRNIAYLRVSTIDQDTEKNKHDILKFCNDRNFGKVDFIEEKVSGKVSWKERKIKGIVDDLQPGDRLVLPEISRLGRSSLECMEILSILKEKNVAVYAIKGNWELNGSIQSKVMAMIFSLVAEIERDFISSRTKEGLAAARLKGRLIGRPAGIPGRSKLDKHREEIIALLSNRSPKSYVAKKYGSTTANLYNWLLKNKIEIKEA